MNQLKASACCSNRTNAPHRTARRPSVRQKSHGWAVLASSHLSSPARATTVYGTQPVGFAPGSPWRYTGTGAQRRCGRFPIRRKCCSSAMAPTKRAGVGSGARPMSSANCFMGPMASEHCRARQRPTDQQTTCGVERETTRRPPQVVAARDQAGNFRRAGPCRCGPGLRRPVWSSPGPSKSAVLAPGAVP